MESAPQQRIVKIEATLRTMETKPVVWFKLELIELHGCGLPEHELVWVRRMQFILSRGKLIPCNIVVGVQHLPI